MARTGRPKSELTLSDVERETLQRWARRAKTAQALALRARIVLACADGASSKDVAVSVGVTEATVGKWRRRFVAERLGGLDDGDRPGRPRTIRDEEVERVVVDTLEANPPDGGTHWSTRLMAAHTGMTQTAVSRIWRAFGLKPHKVDYWKLSTDPNFIDKLYDVVGLYLNPPERAIVLCADEKSNIQALDRSAPLLPMMPVDPARQTHDYIRHGTSSLFAALDVATGKVITGMHRRHRAVEFKRFLNQINREVPADLAVHLILDNYATHKTPDIKAWLLRHPRFHLHFHPNQLKLAQPRGTLVRRSHHPHHPPRHPPQRRRTRNRHQQLDRALEHRPTTIRVGERPPNSSSNPSPPTANDL